MSLKNDHYPYRVTWPEEDQEYVGLCTEFPSLGWLDSSPEKALKGIRQVIAECVADLVKNKEQIPESRNISIEMTLSFIVTTEN